MTSFISVLIVLLSLASTLLPIAAYCSEPVKIGVLSFRPKPQTLAQWEPLAAALKQAVPERDFVVEPLTYPEMNTAVADRKIDFVLTNPSHYVLLARRSGLSAPLATLAAEIKGKRTSSFGGVIFCRAEQKDINTVQDIKGKTIAVPDTESLGGYQMQAYELKKVGVRLPQDATLIATGMPHDKVVQAVLSGRADVGFVRSGVLEGNAREGKLDITQLKILNLQNRPEFPLLISTRLYPDWPFVAMPHIDENLARHVAAALFVLEENSPSIHDKGIHGFVVPADYLPVEEVLRELRFPPFEGAPSFTTQDVWRRYSGQITAALIAICLIVMLAIRLLTTNRKLVAERCMVQQKQNELRQSEERFKELFEEAPLGIALIDSHTGHIYLVNPMFAKIAGRTEEEMVEIDWMSITHPDDVQEDLDNMALMNSGKTDGFQMEKRYLHKDGTVVWINMTIARIKGEDNVHPRHLCMIEDITERKKAENEREEALARVNKLEGIIPICMHCKKIRDDQNSWNQLEEYITSHSEAMFSHGICPHCLAEQMKIIDKLK
ncbi:MAG: PhnD/SsuA/transferrin family substrate-binding protein [Deltaproteobacteria bacterium]